jgi:hypothetical protein
VTLAAAVARELYTPLMHPPTTGAVIPGHGEPHGDRRFEERTSNPGRAEEAGFDGPRQTTSCSCC